MKKKTFFTASALTILSLTATAQTWDRIGNTVGSSEFIGSTNLQDFVIKTNGIEKVRVATGTVANTNLVEIKSNPVSSTAERLFNVSVTDASADYMRIVNGTSANSNFVPTLVGYKGNTSTFSTSALTLMGSLTGSIDSGTPLNTGEAVMHFNVRDNFGGIGNGNPVINRPAFSWANYTTKLMTILANGYVGIGTVTPEQKLHIHNGAIQISGDNTYGGAMLLLGNSTGNNNTWGIENNALGLNFWRPFVGGQPNQGNYFLFLKHSNGNVGIKTNDPKADLHVIGKALIGSNLVPNGPNADYVLGVDGKLVAKEVVVNISNWADYVFDENYHLTSLDEVETYIAENKHLPNVPSEKEMKENGADLAKNDAMLMRKIEELTLYVIELKKENEAIKAEMKNQTK